MNQSQNNTTPLTEEEINALSGDELKNALDQQVQGYKNEAAKINDSLKDISDKVMAMPEVDEEKTKKEDDEAIEEMKKHLDIDMDNAMLDGLATEDSILKDIESEGDDEGAAK